MNGEMNGDMNQHELFDRLRRHDPAAGAPVNPANGPRAAALMEQIMQTSRQLGAKALWVQTESFNKASQSFFKGHGFRQNTYLNFERPL